MKQKLWRYLPTGYFVCMVVIMLGYVRYDAYQIDGDAVTYMDIADLVAHGQWHKLINGLWNPGYPALLALGKLLTHAVVEITGVKPGTICCGWKLREIYDNRIG